MEKSRSQNAILNIAVGFIAQFVIMILAFVNRRIFVSYLSVDYLGINGLYSNILSVLALAEMGLGYVVQFYFYKPVVEKNYSLITTLTHYFKKLYMIIALAVLMVGLSIIPLLGNIVNSNLDSSELIIYYDIFLVNSVLTYFSAHKIALLAAYQDNRLQKYVNMATNICFQFIHLAILIIWHSYLIYTLATVLSTILNVIAVNLICDKKYPYLKNKELINRDLINTSDIKNNVRSTFIYKVGATIVNNTDNILISMIVSTAAVGLYSNYLMVTSTVQTLITIVTTAVISGIGNLSAEGNKDKMLKNFDMLLLFYHFISAYCAISFYFLFNDLIPLWLGNEYVMNQGIVMSIALNFYLVNAISPVYMFRESNGLFSKVKYLLLTTAIVNIILSVVLGRIIGVTGILLATVVAKIGTQVWYEPYVIFKPLFGIGPAHYWKQQVRYVMLTILCVGFCYVAAAILPHSLVFMIIKAVLFFLLVVIVFYLGTCKTEAHNSLKKLMLNVLKYKLFII